MVTQDRRREIRDEINSLKEKRRQYKDEIPGLKEAQKGHVRWSRTREGRKVGYQGEYTDRRLDLVFREISRINDEINSLYAELNG